MSVTKSVTEYIAYQAELYEQVVHLKVKLVEQEQATEKWKTKYDEVRSENSQLQAQLRSNGHTPFAWVS